MTQTFVIPDVHGSALILSKTLNIIPDSAKIIFLGDYIDRGVDNRGALSLVKDAVKNRGAIALCGNHDALMVGAYDNDENSTHTWFMNGGMYTFQEYGYHKDEMTEDVEWIRQLPILHTDKYRVYVHGWIDTQKPITEQEAGSVMWKRFGKNDDYDYQGLHIVHGHTPVKEPLLLTNRTNLDTGAVWHNVLTVGVFDDDTPGGPIDIWSIAKDE